MLLIKDLTFKFLDATRPIIDGINLKVEKGDFILVTGDSGSGKTTLAQAIGGFLFSSDKGEICGEVLFKDESLREYSLADISQKIFLVQQNPDNQFCTLMVQDEIAFGLENQGISPNEIQERIDYALKSVHASELLKRDLRTLSGGEKQKVAIATALAMRPEVIILDEPTAFLDNPSIAQLTEILQELIKHKEITLIVIEHKYHEFLRFHPKVFSLENGNLKLLALENLDSFPYFKLIETSIGLKEHYLKKVVEFENVNIYRNEKRILQIEELNVREGDFVSLTGKNGSGKTTLLYGLLGLTPINGKKTFVLNKEYSDSRELGKTGQAGIVFQNPNHQFFTESVVDEINYPIDNYGRDIINRSDWLTKLLRKFGLDHHKNTHPIKLSYGQKKRLSVASVLSFQPKLLLLDEIFIGQSIKESVFLLKLILTYVVEFSAAVILVNHIPNLVNSYVNRTVFLEDGSVAFDGSPEEINSGRFLFGYGSHVKGENART